MSRHKASETGHSINHFHENRNVSQTEVILRKLKHQDIGTNIGD